MALPIPSQDESESFMLGDGFYPFKGTRVVDGITRNLKDLNGEVIPGTPDYIKHVLTVHVREYYALADGKWISYNANYPKQKPYVTIKVTTGYTYLVVQPKFKGSEWIGSISQTDTLPGVDSGVLVLATLNIPPDTEIITAEMIDNSMKQFLAPGSEVTPALIGAVNINGDVMAGDLYFSGSGVFDVGTASIGLLGGTPITSPPYVVRIADPLVILNVQEYPDNATASMYLEFGSVYRTGDVLKIVHY